MKWLEELDRLYRTHRKFLHGLTGLGLITVIVLYLYHLSKQPEAPQKELTDAVADPE